MIFKTKNLDSIANFHFVIHDFYEKEYFFLSKNNSDHYLNFLNMKKLF
jgi:hypothetical protein